MFQKKHAKRTFGALFALCIAVLGMAFIASPASAHTPAASADCSGIKVSGTNYEAAITNTLSITLDGGAAVTKDFATDGSLTVPVPQDGQVHQWTADVDTSNGQYELHQSGNVGPCGNPQPPNQTAHKSDDRSSCADGVEHREWDEVTTFAWDGNTWVPTTTVQNDTGWVHVRDLTAQEKADLNCDKPNQPPAQTRQVPHREDGCKLGGVHTWTDVFTTEYVWDATTFTWVLGQETGPVHTDDQFTPYTKAQLKDCAEVKGEQAHQPHPVVHHTVKHHPQPAPVQQAVPTQVESGLASTSLATAAPASATAAASGGVNRGLAVAGFGLLTVLAAAVVRKHAL